MKTVASSSGSKSRGGSPSTRSLLLSPSRPFTSSSPSADLSPSSGSPVIKPKWPPMGGVDDGDGDEFERKFGFTATSSLLHQHHQPQPRHPRSVPTKHQTVLVVCYVVTCITLSSIPGTAGIDCFKCVSLNGKNPSCEDPFHNNYSISILESPCMGGRKGRNGLFPATACIKLAGRYSDTGESMVVRTCAVDSGTLTLDTELARMSHCGFFYFDDRYVKGCLQSCDDADGCNRSSRLDHFATCLTALLLLVTSIGLPAYFFASAELHFYSFAPSLL